MMYIFSSAISVLTTIKMNYCADFALFYVSGILANVILIGGVYKIDKVDDTIKNQKHPRILLHYTSKLWQWIQSCTEDFEEPNRSE